MNIKKSSEMPNAHLHDLFIDGLKEMLGAETKLLKELRGMQEKAKSEELKQAFEDHYLDTEGHISSVQTILENMGEDGDRERECKAMEGLIQEGEEIISAFEASAASDAALISVAQKIEHYEIASYGCLLTYAKLMRHKEAGEILSIILDQEKDTDALLTEIATGGINTAENPGD